MTSRSACLICVAGYRSLYSTLLFRLVDILKVFRAFVEEVLPEGWRISRRDCLTQTPRYSQSH